MWIGRTVLRQLADVPDLWAVHRRQRLSGDDLDSSEAVVLRQALTDLGGRERVVPPPATSLLTPAVGDEPSWPSARLAEVIGDLADHGQAVLYFQLWRVAGADSYWTDHDRFDEALDLTLPWAEVVEAAREKALLEAAFVVPRPDLVATVEWVDRSDL